MWNVWRFNALPCSFVASRHINLPKQWIPVGEMYFCEREQHIAARFIYVLVSTPYD